MGTRGLIRAAGQVRRGLSLQKGQLEFSPHAVHLVLAAVHSVRLSWYIEARMCAALGHCTLSDHCDLCCCPEQSTSCSQETSCSDGPARRCSVSLMTFMEHGISLAPHAAVSRAADMMHAEDAQVAWQAVEHDTAYQGLITVCSGASRLP